VPETFGNYRGLSINPISGVIEKTSTLQETLYEELGVIDQKNAIQMRDEKIAAWLHWWNVNFLLDVGCDFGSLLNECNKLGIESLGYDIDQTSISLLSLAKLNFRRVSIEEIVQAGNLLLPNQVSGEKLMAVSCLNILHSGNLDATTREEFVRICLSNADFVVITLTKRMLRQLGRKLSFQVNGFVGANQKPISDYQSQLLQYGATFRFKGKLGYLEKSFWRILHGQYSYPQPHNSYDKLVVIISKVKDE
jgi:hypothetical protein